MKHTLLATTALVAFTGGAYAGVTVSGSARIGLMTTEGAAAKTTAAVAAALDVFQVDTGKYLTTTYATGAVTTAAAAAGTGLIANTASTLNGGAALAATAIAATAVTNDLQAIIVDIQKDIAELDTAIGSPAHLQMAEDLALAQGLLAAARGTAASTVAAGADTTTGVNRVRVSFAMSGETDSGMAFGASMRADGAGKAATSGGGAHGSAHISGAFGKIKAGDLGGADKDAAGHIAGVGLTGLGTNEEFTYQAGGHNLGYEFSTNGITFGYSQNTAVQTGSNSAMGLKWSGDMGGTTVTVGIGTSKVGTSTQNTVSAAVSMGGLTVKAVSSTNDNGPVVAAVAGRAKSGITTALSYRAAADEDTTPDTDHTGMSISYAMDAMSVTAFTRTEATAGTADKDYSGFGFAYDMGGVTLKAGVVDAEDISYADFGVSFSF
jgi:outer membrane protein OmpU